MKTSEVLRKAGDVLRERGWCQGWFRDEAGRVCAQGACNAAIDNAPEDHAAADRIELTMLVRAATGHDIGLPSWNDTPGRTAAEVMHALDAAYVLALQEEGEDPADYEVL